VGRFVKFAWGAAAFLSGYAAWLCVWINDVDRDIEEHRRRIAALESEVAEGERIRRSADRVEQQEAWAEDLAARPVSGSEILDRVWTVLDREKSLTVEDMRWDQAPRPRPGRPCLTLKCRILGNDLSKIVALRMALANEPYLKERLSFMDRLFGVVTSVRDGRVQMEFEIVMIGNAVP
jgi:hypothetical protein